MRLFDARLQRAGSLDERHHPADVARVGGHAVLAEQPVALRRRILERHQAADHRRGDLALDEVLRLGLERLAEALQVDHVVEDLEGEAHREEVVAQGRLLRARRAAEDGAGARADGGGQPRLEAVAAEQRLPHGR